MLEAFWQTPHPIFDPLGFLHLSLGGRTRKSSSSGAGLSAEARPRATCAVCLVQDSAAYWAHVGDSRIYQLRQAQVLERTRDHSHVEVLLREGLITESEVQGHPMRNYVECCLGGDAALPEMSISARRQIEARRCAAALHRRPVGQFEGSGISCASRRTTGKPLRDSLNDLGTQAVRGLRTLQRQHQRRRAALAGGMSVRPSGRAPDQLRELTFERGYTQACGRLRAGELRRDPRAVHRQHRGQRARIPARGCAGLGDRGIRHAAAGHPYTLRSRGRARQANRPHPGNSAPDRPGAARGGRPEGPWANAR